MRENLHHLVSIEPAFAGRKSSGNRKRGDLGVLLYDLPRQFGISGMSGFHGNDVPTNTGAYKCQVTDNVEDFVTREFVGETQWFFAQDSLAADYNGVFQTTTFDQIFLHERRDFFVINERSRGRDFAFVN